MDPLKHALTQDVAYARVADAERERLHAAAGAAIEERHAARLDEHLDRLAYHFDRTTDHAKAIDYLSRLARRMEASYALAETIDALEHAIAHCAHLSPQQEADRRVVTLVNQMAVPLALLGRAAEIEARLRPYQLVIDAENDPSLASRFYLSLAMACDFTGRFRDAERLATQALEQAEKAGDRRTIGQVLVIMAQSSLWTCAYREGASRALRSREYLDEDVGSLWRGMAVWFTTLHLAQLGRLDQALDAAWQTLDLARDAGDPRMESYGLCLIGWITGRKGNARDGLERCHPTVELAPDANARMVIRCFLGQLAIAAGELELARNELRHGFEACRDAGFWPFAVWNLSWLSVAELSAGDAAQALRLADEALVMADKVDFALGRGLALRARGLALAAARRATEATASLTAAVDAFVALGAAYDAALCHLDLTRVLADEGTKEAATNHLSAARSLFAEMGVDLDAVGARHLSHLPGVEPQKEKGDAV